MKPPTTLPLAVLLACALAGSSTIASAGALPERYTAEYTMHAYGSVVGRARTRLSTNGASERVYEHSSWPEGLAKLLVNQTIVERTSWTLHEGVPRPQRYEHRREGRKPRRTRIEFDWANMQVSGQRKGEPVSLALPEGAHDKMTYVLAMMLDLAGGKTDLSYPVTDGGKLSTYRFTAPRSVRLDTALGTLSTLELKRIRDGGERETTYWFAPELRYVPVQIEHKEKGEHVTARIKSIQW